MLTTFANRLSGIHQCLESLAINDQDFTIPRDIEARYEGRWIAWDTDTQQVLADGETMSDVVAAATPQREQQHLIWYHHVPAPGTVLVGGLW